jgi:hypothetical protein
VDENEKESSAHIVAERRFVGELTDGQDRIAVSFVAGAGQDGEVGIRLEPIPRSAEVFAMERRWGEIRVKGELYSLSGVAADGATFESTEVLFKSFGHHFDQDTSHTYRPSALYQRCAFRLPLAEPAEHPVLRLWIKGFESFDVLQAPCPLGVISMSGAGQLDDPDRIAGVIEIKGDKAPDDVETWLAAAENLAWHIRSIMSFAAAVTLRAPLSEVIHGATTIVSCRSQVRQIRSTMRNFDKLNLQPIFDAAVQSHFEPTAELDGIGMAIEWIAQESTYNEIRLFSAMTALEHLINLHLSEADKQVMVKERFSDLRQNLLKTLESMRNEENSDAFDEIESKLGDINRRSLRRKLDILIKKWAVPLEGIGETRLRDAVYARNRVVHTGQHHDESLWPHVTVIRELMVRIILTALRFKGQYATYLDGARYVEFPPSGTGGGFTRA